MIVINDHRVFDKLQIVPLVVLFAFKYYILVFQEGSIAKKNVYLIPES